MHLNIHNARCENGGIFIEQKLIFLSKETNKFDYRKDRFILAVQRRLLQLYTIKS